MYQQRENWQLKSLQAGTDGTGKEERQTGWNTDYNIGVGSKEAGGIEEMKKKTRNMLFGLAAVFVLVIAGAAFYKAMH